MDLLDGIMLSSHGEWTDPERVMFLITQHLRLRPLMQAQDVYKLIYQGVMGSEHLMNVQGIEDVACEFEKRLRLEFEAVEPDESEPLFELIPPTGMLHRLNLRPYKAQHGDLARLVTACMEVVYRSWGSPDDLCSVWDVIVDASQKGNWSGVAIADILPFTEWLKVHSFPAIHHSRIYREAYRPAYRLVNSNTINI
jgi:hypothetical protein